MLEEPLGAPWRVHDCWEQHREQQRYRIFSLEEKLELANFNGSVYTTRGIFATAPKLGSKKVDVNGFVVGTHSIATGHEQFDLSFLRNDAQFTWVTVFVRDKLGVLYPFAVPEKTARKIVTYSVVRMKGRWESIHQSDFLLAERLTVEEFPEKHARSIQIVSLGSAHIKCGYCRRLVAKNRWGINSARRVECQDCATLRGSISPSLFLRRVRKIARSHPK